MALCLEHLGASSSHSHSQKISSPNTALASHWSTLDFSLHQRIFQKTNSLHLHSCHSSADSLLLGSCFSLSLSSSARSRLSTILVAFTFQQRSSIVSNSSSDSRIP